MSTTSKKNKKKKRARFRNKSPCPTCPLAAICFTWPEELKEGRRCVHCKTDFVGFALANTWYGAALVDYRLDHDSCPIVQYHIEHYNDILPEYQHLETCREEVRKSYWKRDMLCLDCRTEFAHKESNKNKEIPVLYRWRNRRKLLSKRRPR